jgi:hypothetical protein
MFRLSSNGHVFSGTGSVRGKDRVAIGEYPGVSKVGCGQFRNHSVTGRRTRRIATGDGARMRVDPERRELTLSSRGDCAGDG